MVKRMCQTYAYNQSAYWTRLVNCTTHSLPREHAQTLLVHRVAPPQNLVQHPSKRNFFVRRSAQAMK